MYVWHLCLNSFKLAGFATRARLIRGGYVVHVASRFMSFFFQVE